MSHRDDPWEKLLADLHERSWFQGHRENRLLLQLPGQPGRTIEVLITPQEWAEMVGIAFGTVPAALTAFTWAVQALPPPETRLYYESYRIVRSVDLEPTSFSSPPTPAPNPKRAGAFSPTVMPSKRR
jgi:hypothetical protein